MTHIQAQPSPVPPLLNEATLQALLTPGYVTRCGVVFAGLHKNEFLYTTPADIGHLSRVAAYRELERINTDGSLHDRNDWRLATYDEFCNNLIPHREKIGSFREWGVLDDYPRYWTSYPHRYPEFGYVVAIDDRAESLHKKEYEEAWIRPVVRYPYPII